MMISEKEKSLWLVKGKMVGDQASLYAELCAEVLESVCLTVSFYETDAETSWTFEGITEAPPQLDILQTMMAGVLPVSTSSFLLTCEPLPSLDWLKESYRAFPPLTIGCLYLHGSHHEGPLPSDKHCILVDAATAFGSGHHATTAGCLVLLQELARITIWEKPLDLGCGSGILAMAIALMNKEATVLATDNDPEAVRVAQKNISLNQLEDQVTASLSDGFTHLTNIGPFDLILANILAGPLIALAPEMSTFVSSGGHVILSGFLEEQRSSVQKTYESNGFQYIKHHTEDRWISLCLQRVPQSKPHEPRLRLGRD